MSRRSKSIVAPNMQTPVAIGLSILLVALLGWRIQQARRKARAAPAAAVVAEAAPFQSHLPEMLKTYVIDSLAHPVRSPLAAPIARDPFGKPHAPLERLRAELSDALEVQDEAPEALAAEAAQPEPRDWQARASALSLNGIAQVGQETMALINGQYVKAGGQIDGLSLVRLGDFGVELRDMDGGMHMLIMKGPQI